MVIGFTSGRYGNEEKFLDKLKFFLSIGANALELHPRIDAPSDFQISGKAKEFININFDYVSLHLPSGDFEDLIPQTSESVYDAVDNLIEDINIKNIVVHPDTIKNSEELKRMNWPICLENMDNRKKDGRTVNELEKWFKKFPEAGMVLDLNHVYTNDDSMKLADDLVNAFLPKIKELHISGYVNEKKLHEPFFKSNCDFIFKKIPDKDLPMILEAFVGDMTKDEIKKEIEYVRSNL